MITRRQIITGLAASGAMAFWPRRRLAAQGWLASLPQESAPALAAAVDRILPGATAAGALSFIEYWVARPAFIHLKRDLMVATLVMNRLAGQRHGKPFAACAPADQDAILSSLRDRQTSAGRFDSRLVYERLVSLTLESFLGDPKYGGNRDQVGWRLAGVQHCWYAPKRVRRRTGLPY